MARRALYGADPASMKRTLAITAFLAPALLLYGGLVVLSFGKTAWYSLFKWNGQTAMRFVGLANFAAMTRDVEVTGAILHNLVAVVMAVVVQVGTAVVIAVLLSRVRRGYAALRAVFFLPVVVSSVAFALMWVMFFNPEFGLVNALLRGIGLPGLATAWLANPRTTLVCALLPQTTQGIGWQMVILLAAIESIPSALHEVADLEGIRFFQRTRYVIIPLIWEAMQICIVVAVLNALQGFTHIMVLTGGGPNRATNLVGLAMYHNMFTYSNLGYGSAIAVVIVAVALLFSVVFKRYFSTADVQY
jgi:raffinose/stachyose/melibiose transport system permease protein